MKIPNLSSGRVSTFGVFLLAFGNYFGNSLFVSLPVPLWVYIVLFVCKNFLCNHPVIFFYFVFISI